MATNIKINIVEPGSPAPTPIDPTIDPSVPNTGLFTHGIGTPEATVIVSVVLVLAIVSIVLTAYMYRRNKKAGKVTKLVHIIDSTKAVIKSKKRISSGLAAIAFLVSAGTFIALAKNGVNASEGEEQATEDTNNSSLTVTESSQELTVEVSDSPVFAVLPVELTVEEATKAGYTLTAFTDSTDLASTTDNTNIIPMATLPESLAETLESSETAGELTTLTDNTYGLSLSEPTTKDEAIYTTLSTDSSTPTFITDKDYEATEANDTTTIYYGFYITPDVPKGTYVSGDVNYEVEANRTDLATVVYNGNGLYFNGNESKIANKARYEVTATDYTEKYSYTPNLNSEGESGSSISFGTYVNDPITVPGATKVKISLKYGIYDGFYNDNGYWAYMTIWQGNHPEYTAGDNYSSGIRQCGDMTTSDGRINGHAYEPVTVECEIPGDSVTFGFWTQPGGGPGIGYGYHAVVTGYDTDGNTIYLPDNSLVSGKYQEPAQDLPYIFLGWSEDRDATAPTYKSAEDIEMNLLLSAGEATTLYAIWQHATSIVYDGNGGEGGQQRQTIHAGDTNRILSNWGYFVKDGHYILNWNTESDGSGTAYNQGDSFTASDQSQIITLYAQWKPLFIISYNGNGSDNITDMKNVKQYTSDSPVGKQVDLLASNFQRKGYGFIGWSTDVDAWEHLVNGDDFNSPIIYGPSQTITVNENLVMEAGEDGILVLYAVWAPSTGNIQNYVCPNNSDFPIGSITALTDIRDGNVYAVAKLADGNCWMIENLRLGSTRAIELTSENTQTAGILPAATVEWNDNKTAQQINTDNTLGTTASPSFSHDFTHATHEDFNDNIYSYGNYYSWPAAINSASISSNSNTSICPSGWHLPIGGAGQDFAKLDVAMGGIGGYQYTIEASNRWRSFPNNFVPTGVRVGSSIIARGGVGQWWSSTIRNNNSVTSADAYYMYLYANSVGPDSYSTNTSSGSAVRCMVAAE